MAKKSLLIDGLMMRPAPSLVRRLTPGILRGKGVFETLRVYRSMPFALEQHLARMMKGLEVIGLPCPYPRRKIREFLGEILGKHARGDARVRLTVWQEGKRARLAVMSASYQPPSPAVYKRGYRAVFSDIRRDEDSPLVRIKSIRYLPLLQAWRKARQRGQDEALVLNRKGFLAEASRSNIFVLKSGILMTPSLSSGCLDGITRRLVIRLARERGLRVRQKRMRPEELFDADEAFLTNALIEVMPLTRVQGFAVGKGRAGQYTRALAGDYRRLVRNALRSDRR